MPFGVSYLVPFEACNAIGQLGARVGPVLLRTALLPLGLARQKPKACRSCLMPRTIRDRHDKRSRRVVKSFPSVFSKTICFHRERRPSLPFSLTHCKITCIRPKMASRRLSLLSLNARSTARCGASLSSRLVGKTSPRGFTTTASRASVLATFKTPKVLNEPNVR